MSFDNNSGLVKNRDLVKIEEVLNILLRDEKIQKRRRALVDFVMERLKEWARFRMEQVGLNQEFERRLQAGEQTLFPILQEKSKELKLSQKQLADLKRMNKVDPLAAWEHLQELMLDKQVVRFPQDADMPVKVWRSFVNQTVLPAPATLDKIKAHLNMTAELQAQFDSRVIRYTFEVDDTLRKEVLKLRERTGMTLTDFMNYAYIGKEAWEAFYPVKGNPSKLKKTSQATLLKLVVGFGLDEPEAWDFMDTAKSTFVVRRDMVVLSGIRCGFRIPDQVAEILEFFAQNKNGEPYYTSIYG